MKLVVNCFSLHINLLFNVEVSTLKQFILCVINILSEIILLQNYFFYKTLDKLLLFLQNPAPLTVSVDCKLEFLGQLINYLFLGQYGRGESRCRRTRSLC